jgi:hypothetical protein
MAGKKGELGFPNAALSVLNDSFFVGNSIVYSLVARETVILSEFAAGTGTFILMPPIDLCKTRIHHNTFRTRIKNFAIERIPDQIVSNKPCTCLLTLALPQGILQVSPGRSLRKFRHRIVECHMFVIGIFFISWYSMV